MTLLRRDGRASFFALQGLYPQECTSSRVEWRTQAGSTYAQGVRPEEHGYHSRYAYGASGEVWQTTGHYGTVSEEYAMLLLRLTRENEERVVAKGEPNMRTKPMQFRVVHVLLMQSTVEVLERETDPAFLTAEQLRRAEDPLGVDPSRWFRSVG